MANPNCRILLLLAGCILLFCQPTVVAQSEFTGTTMGPIAYRVVVYEVDDEVKLKQGIQSELDRVNDLMSTYVSDSDVSRVNAADAEKWTEVNPLTLKVIEKAIEISKLTSGAFDITVGPAVRRWKFGPDAEQIEYPSDAEVADMLSYVGFGKLNLQADPPSIQKSDSRTQIDLSAIAKGFAVDQVAMLLKSEGYENFMVEVGGEVYASGRKPDAKWRIGIEKPKFEGCTLAVSGAIEISDVAVATSGDYRNTRIYNGQRISHTINPATCRPVLDSPASCSVIAADCMTADAIATAIMVMGAKRGMELCLGNDFDANIANRMGNDSSNFKSVTSDNFPQIQPIQTKANSATQPQSIWPAFAGALIIFSLAILGMAVGAIFNEKPISGSCGGIAAKTGEDGDTSCSLCHKPVAECPEEQEVT